MMPMTSRVVRSADDVLALIRDVMVEDNRFFILLAKHLSISQKHLSQIMTGNAKLSAQRMFDILTYLELRVWVERE
jgi:16S rRNA C1402 (ribose-2'-O) methylase RsmI